MSESPQMASVWGWRGAASGVVHCLKQLLDTGERTDIQFAVGREYGDEQLFRAHKLVLSLRSDVLDAMFYGEVPETSEKIEFPDILPQAFAVFLKYLYTDVVEDLSVENAMPTMYCANKYGIPKLFDVCVEYAMKNVDKNTCLTMLEEAKVLDAEKLVTKCLEMVDTHAFELLQSEGFLQLKKETLREIFSRDTLIIKEEEVYKAAKRWAANACRCSGTKPIEHGASYRAVLGEAFFAIRFPLMEDEQLASGPLAAGLLLDEELCTIHEFKHAAEKPDIPFSHAPRSSDIAFCDHRWIVLDWSETRKTMVTADNAFLDAHGHLHLRVAQHDGAWKGAAVQLLEGVGFGRYEFHIEGLGRLQLGAGFTLMLGSKYTNGWACMATFLRVRGPDGESNHIGIRFSVRRQFGDSAEFCHSIEGPEPLLLTHSFHWRPDSVALRSQRGYQHNNTEEELCNWLYDCRPKFPETALPLGIFCLPYPADTPLDDGKEVEIVVHALNFCPDA